MALRKAIIFSSVLSNNAGSFVNVTSDRLHIRMLDLVTVSESGASTPGDSAQCSIDEVPVAQVGVNDSRSHIMSAQSGAEGGTASVEATSGSKTLPFNRNDLVLDPDEAIFMNNIDVSGNLGVGFALNVWYED